MTDVFSPVTIGALTLRNRIIKAATFEGMTPGGMPSDALIRHHREIAAGGVGMTTVAYCSVSSDGLTFGDQMHMRDEVLPGLERLVAAVHAEGAACALQLGHAGYFASPEAIGTRPMGASRRLCLYTLSVCRAMTEADIERLVGDFARAAGRARDLGFDAIEIHFGHGYLLSQFLSPFTNRRRDVWGGSLENRLRFPLQVVRGVRDAVGAEVAVMAKINLEDGFESGLQISEAVEVARALESEGVDALVLSGGFVTKTPFYMLRGELPVKEMVRNERRWLRRVGLTLFGHLLVPSHRFEPMFFVDLAREVRKTVDMPLVLLGGIRTLDDMRRAMADGFDLVSMGRPLIMEPDLVARMQAGETTASTCVPCNKCVAEMEAGGIWCPLQSSAKRSE